MVDLADRIRTAADRVGGLKRLAELVDVPRRTLGNWLSGVSPKPEALKKIAKAANVSLDWLVTGEGFPEDDAMTGGLRMVERMRAEQRAELAFQEDQPPYGEAQSEPVKTSAPDKPTENETAIMQKLDWVVDQLTKMAAEKVEQKPAPVIPSRAPPTVTYLPFRASAGGGSAVLEDSPGFQLDFDELSQKILGMRPKNMRLIEIYGDSMLPTFQSGDIVVADMSYPRGDSLPDNGQVYVIAKDGELLVKRALWAEGGVLKWTSDNPDYAPIKLRGPDLNQVKIVGRVVWLWRRAH